MNFIPSVKIRSPNIKTKGIALQMKEFKNEGIRGEEEPATITHHCLGLVTPINFEV